MGILHFLAAAAVILIVSSMICLAFPAFRKSRRRFIKAVGALAIPGVIIFAYQSNHRETIGIRPLRSSSAISQESLRPYEDRAQTLERIKDQGLISQDDYQRAKEKLKHFDAPAYPQAGGNPK